LGIPLATDASAYLSKAESAPVIPEAVTVAIPGPPLRPTVYGMELLQLTETAGAAPMPVVE
jgi:hypothetical protein